MIDLVHDYLTSNDRNAINAYITEKSNKNAVDVINHTTNCISDVFGSNHCYLVNSGSAALHTALCALNIGSGDEVVTTTHTCVAILNAIRYMNATPVLCDITYSPSNMNYNIDISSIEDNISHRTKAIIIPHMFGVGVELNNLKYLNIPIIEDITLSFGAKFKKGDLLGTMGDITISSFHRSKMISADVGGLVIINNTNYVANVSRILDYDGNLCMDTPPSYNYGMGEINAQLLKSQLAQLTDFIKMRNDNATFYRRKLSNRFDIITPNIESDEIYFRYIIELPPHITSSQVVANGLEYNIQFGRGVYPALHNILKLDHSLFPMSEKAQRRTVTLPVYPGLTKVQLEYITSSLVDIIGG